MFFILFVGKFLLVISNTRPTQMDFHKKQLNFLKLIVFFVNICKDNGFAEMLYQIKWEILPINIQKAVMLLIHRKQNERGLSLGPFAMGVNRESFKLVRIQILFKLYSFIIKILMVDFILNLI